MIKWFVLVIVITLLNAWPTAGLVLLVYAAERILTGGVRSRP
jgi:hypothetical protein